MKLLIIAGSGLSIPAGYPSTLDLTNVIRRGEGAFLQSDGTFAVRELAGNPDPAHDAFVQLIVKYLAVLEPIATSYYAARRRVVVNYEHLYYLALQVTDSETGEHDNPAMGALVDSLRSQVEALIESSGIDPDERPALANVSNAATQYIADLAWQSLRVRRDTAHLQHLVELVQDARLDEVSLYSLNHDTLIERALGAANVSFVDGFSNPINKVSYWEPQRLAEPGASRRLIKLHGSVDWFWLRPEGAGFDADRVGRIVGYPYDTLSPDNRPQDPIEGHPAMLVGTHNKAVGYLEPPFDGAQFEFYRSLSTRDTETVMLIVGYGGQDKAINSRVVEWMEAVPSRRLVIVDPVAETLSKTARRGLGFGIERWRAERRLSLISRDVRDVTASDYRTAIGL